MLRSTQTSHWRGLVQLRWKSSSASVANQAKPYSDIPGPREIPFIGSFFGLLGQPDGYHMFYEKLHKTYGDIARFTVFGVKQISVSRPEHIQEVYFSNQSAPLRESLDPWVNYRISRGLPLGVAMELSQRVQDEDKWRRFRRPVAKLLRPELVASYVPRVAHVGLDLVKALKELKGQELGVPELRKFTSAYGFQAIAAVLMGRSMKILETIHTGGDPRYIELMNAVDKMFRTSSRLIFDELPLWRWFRTNTIEAHDKAWDDIFRLARGFFAMKEGERDPRYKDGATDFFEIMFDDMDKLKESEKLSESDRTLLGVEVLAAGIDTTSMASQWIVLYMAQHPEVQERLASLLERVMGPLGKPTLLTHDMINEAKLLHFVDEILRLHPILPNGARMYSKDVVLCGYNIPAFTRINLSNWVARVDERNYQEPLKFDETRGPRKECPFGSKTFGAGSRQCPGERFARMELAVLLGTLVHQFKIVSSDASIPLRVDAKLLLAPRNDPNLKVKFIPR